MLKSGMNPMEIADNMQTPLGSPAVLGDPNVAGSSPLPPGMTPGGGTPESAPSMETGEGPAGPTPVPAMAV
jgi:hypothetical protein